MTDRLKKARRYILAGLMSCLGFTACDPDSTRDMYGPPPAMYGPAPDEYEYLDEITPPSQPLPDQEAVDGRL